MKIERDGNTFTIKVVHHAHAETLEALLRVIALTIAGPNLPGTSDPAICGGQRHPVSGLTLTLGVNPWLLNPMARAPLPGTSRNET
ncbi:MAG: hypothetical protein BGO49_11340 [Planctomycetales bacterium 71-10]|nr:MAG: hypothetical protein BGO49_11340 [Planctomycetales bacterium 71-10]